MSLRDLALDCKDVGEIAIVLLGPKLRAGHCIREVSADPDATVGAANASLEQMADPESPGDLAPVALRARFVVAHATAADHLQVSDFSEIAQNVIMNPFGEEEVLRARGEVFERQNRDTFVGRGCDVRTDEQPCDDCSQDEAAARCDGEHRVAPRPAPELRRCQDTTRSDRAPLEPTLEIVSQFAGRVITRRSARAPDSELTRFQIPIERWH